MDKSMWPTLGTLDFLHSSHKWLHTILPTWEIQHSTVDWDYSKTLILLVTFWRLKNHHPEGIFRIFGSRTFVPIGWMCKKQTWLSQSSTESEIISLGAGLWMDGLHSLDIWDVVIEVLCSSNSTKSPKTKPTIKKTIYVIPNGIEHPSHVDHITTNAHPSLSCTSLKTTKQWSRWS